MSLRHFFFLCLLLLNANAMAKHLPDDIEPGASTNEITLPLTKQSAAELIRVETKGKVLSVDVLNKNNVKLFKVRVLHHNGKVKNHLVDAATGHTLH